MVINMRTKKLPQKIHIKHIPLSFFLKVCMSVQYLKSLCLSFISYFVVINIILLTEIMKIKISITAMSLIT